MRIIDAEAAIKNIEEMTLENERSQSNFSAAWFIEFLENFPEAERAIEKEITDKLIKRDSLAARSLSNIICAIALEYGQKDGNTYRLKLDEYSFERAKKYIYNYFENPIKLKREYVIKPKTVEQED